MEKEKSLERDHPSGLPHRLLHPVGLSPTQAVDGAMLKNASALSELCLLHQIVALEIYLTGLYHRV